MDDVDLCYDADVTLDVALAASRCVVWVSQHCPFVVKLTFLIRKYVCFRINPSMQILVYLAAALLWRCPF